MRWRRVARSRWAVAGVAAAIVVAVLVVASLVSTVDTTVVLDAAGRIVWRDPGPTDEATLRAALAEAGLA
jgi:hypothetical protein